MDQDIHNQAPITFSRDAAVKAIALVNIQTEPKTLSELAVWLKRWWCRHYTRPYKDPLLETYTLEELLLEYYETHFLDDPKAREAAEAEIRNDIYADDDEEWLREVMGDKYQSKEEMASLSLDKKK